MGPQLPQDSRPRTDLDQLLPLRDEEGKLDLKEYVQEPCQPSKWIYAKVLKHKYYPGWLSGPGVSRLLVPFFKELSKDTEITTWPGTLQKPSDWTDEMHCK